MTAHEMSRSYFQREMRSGLRVAVEILWPNGQPMVSGAQADDTIALDAMLDGRTAYPWEAHGPGLTFDGWFYFETWDQAVAWVRSV